MKGLCGSFSSFNSCRVVKRTDDYVVIMHYKAAICSEGIIHEFLFCFRGMDKQNIRIPFFTHFKCST